ncbi:MAG: Fe-S cluster assembly protein SufD, partial [Proteobacteria bacterium]|nr:Fe-S cluster assembly protein SufD [Pseudomonadota bacterium]
MRAAMPGRGQPDEALTGFLARYDGLRARLPGSATIRDAAAAVLRDKGWPTPRDEPWHYTNLRPLTGLEFHEAVADTDVGARLIGLLPSVVGPRLIFIDGRFRPDLSVLPPDIDIGSFAAQGAFGTLGRPARERLVALNTMLAEDGAVIDVPAGFDAGFLMLAQLTSGLHRRVGSHPRHRVRLGAGAKLVLLEVSAG